MRLIIVILFFAAVAPTGFAATTARTNAPAPAPAVAPANPTDISAFKIISDRNIFNPNRYARTVRTNDRPRVTTPQSHIEHVALVGTMTYQKGQLAFFDGTSSDVRKPLKVSDTVAGYRLVAIYPDRVKLGVGASHFDLPVGKELRRADGGNWSIADQVESTTSFSGSSNSSSSERSGRGSGRNSGRNGGNSSRETASATTNAPPAAAQNEEIMFDEPGDFPAPPGAALQQIIRVAPGPGATPPAEPGAAVSAPPGAAEAPGGEVNPVLLRLMQQRQQEENR